MPPNLPRATANPPLPPDLESLFAAQEPAAAVGRGLRLSQPTERIEQHRTYLLTWRCIMAHTRLTHHPIGLQLQRDNDRRERRQAKKDSSTTRALSETNSTASCSGNMEARPPQQQLDHTQMNLVPEFNPLFAFGKP